jgi:AbrB family looped-hinge helix DNA binding protein
MSTVTVYNKYQVVIPKDIRETHDLDVGTIMEVISFCSRIELIPIRSMKTQKGLFNGIDTNIEREENRL